MANAIRAIYALAIGIFVVMTVAFGVVSFYQQPERPEYPRITPSRTRSPHRNRTTRARSPRRRSS
jgi:hypothetical protein